MSFCSRSGSSSSDAVGLLLSSRPSTCFVLRPASAAAASMAAHASSRTVPMGWRDIALKPRPTMAARGRRFDVFIAAVSDDEGQARQRLVAVHQMTFFRNMPSVPSARRRSRCSTRPGHTSTLPVEERRSS